MNDMDVVMCDNCGKKPATVDKHGNLEDGFCSDKCRRQFWGPAYPPIDSAK